MGDDVDTHDGGWIKEIIGRAIATEGAQAAIATGAAGISPGPIPIPT
jgi:hypothetical protein